MNKVTGPFTPQQIEAINKWQQEESFHPFTCGQCDIVDPLEAIEEGVICNHCGYVQVWVHDFMANP